MNKAGYLPQDDEKLQYLKRNEVRTMEKDIARLREQEAETAREKVAQLRTEEEVQKAADLSAEVLAGAEERKRMESKAEKKLAQSEALKRARQNEEFLAGKTREKTEELEGEKLRAQLREAQSKEEDERRKFLESVAAKSEGRAVEEKPFAPPAPPPIPVPPPIRTPSIAPDEAIQPTPAPPPTPLLAEVESDSAKEGLPANLPIEAPEAGTEVPVKTTESKKPFKFPLPAIKIPKIRLPKIRLPKTNLPNIRVPKINGYFPGKPSILEKIWIRIVVSLFILAILATLVTFWYWYLVIRNQAIAPQTPVAPAPAPAPPPAPIIKETIPEKPKAIQNFLRSGYYLPPSVRIIDAIILHSGYNASDGNPYDLDDIIQSYKTAAVATHYLIDRDGATYQLAPDYAIAYHSGTGKMPDGRSNVNNFSIGISLIYQENEGPNDIQYQSLGQLIKDLQEKYNIPVENILGYKDINPAKTTPWNFDWDKLKLLLSFAPISPSTALGAEFILDNLALEEKIGQLLIVGIDGTELTPELEKFMKTVQPGGVLLFKKNVLNDSQIKKLIQGLQKISLTETGLPLFVAIDQEGGAVARIDFAKEKTGQPEITNTDQAYGVGIKRGRELKELGVNLNLAPVLDLSVWPTDFLYERSFKKNAEEIGIMAKSLILGQKTAGILTAVKHFPGYGGIFPNPEENLNILAHLPAISQFQTAMEANPALVMVASVVYPVIEDNLPFTFSKNGIAFLKNKLGDNPLIITDDLSQIVFSKNFSLEERVALPLMAGVDILLFSVWENKIIDAVKNIPEQLINGAVLRIIQLKQSYFK